MTHSHHGGTIGIFAVVAAIAFAFGVRTAQIIVGSALIAGAAFFGYVMLRVVMGTL